MKEVGKVFESTSSIIKIKLNDIRSFEENKNEIKIGKYLSVQEGNLNYILVTILNIKSIYTNEEVNYVLETQPIGNFSIDNDKIKFKKYENWKFRIKMKQKLKKI